ncbi:MAG: 3-dehydroquinate synthase [Acidobacteriaceae bacterium]
MSASFDVHASTGKYAVTIQHGLFENMLQQQTAGIFVADEWFAPMLASAGLQAITIPAMETTKSLDAIPELLVQLRKLGGNRQTLLIALGGGIVQDVAAFIASVYMRGLDWIYVPTTLLAMTDSCIGGKSSINVGPYKNLVGTFHPPKSVMIDPKLAISLTDEQRVSGLVEAVKICFCRGDQAFSEYLAQAPTPSMPAEKLEKVVITSLLAKKWFIEIDEFDRAERLLLNFGHTFGHAIEGASHFRIAHGVGVAIGILCAIELGKGLKRNYTAVPQVQVLEEHLCNLLKDVPSLTDELLKLSMDDMLDRFQADKKHRTEYYTVILIAESGTVELLRLPKGTDSLHAIKIAVLNVIRKFSE